MKIRLFIPVMAAAVAVSCSSLKKNEMENRQMISSMGDFARKAEKGAMMNVVFFGGSLTWGANATDPQKTSYRAYVSDALRRKYPKTSFRFIDAAIGGTGSRLGIYRLERDVLQYKPDLLFLDFTLNDGMNSKEDFAYSSFEGIIRKTLAKAKCPVMIVFTASKLHAQDGETPKMLRRMNHKKLTAYYHLPSADIVAGMNKLYKAGKIDLDELWPLELFDTTHPCDKGYKVYADIVMDSYNKAVKADIRPVLPEKWMNKPEYEHVCRAKISDLGKLPKGWRVGMAEVRAGTFDFLVSRWTDNLCIAENGIRLGFRKFEFKGIVPEPLTVKFKGSSVDLFGESTVTGGHFKVTIDGKTQRAYRDAAAFGKGFDPSAYLHMTLAQGLDPKKEHTLTITPVLSNKTYQSLKLESICVCGPEGASVWIEKK